jgi:hypothetical protein
MADMNSNPFMIELLRRRAAEGLANPFADELKQRFGIDAPQPEPPTDAVQQGLSGLNESLVPTMMVVPPAVDLATWLMNLVPAGVNDLAGEGTMGYIEDPFMGSDWVSEHILQPTGVVTPPSSDPTMQAFRSGGQVLGDIAGSAIPMGLVAAGTKAAGAGASVLRRAVDTPLELYRRHPLGATIGDIAAGVSGGSANMLSNLIAPEDPVAELVATLAGAMVPSGLAAGAASLGRSTYTTSEGVADAAARLDAFRRQDIRPTPGAVGDATMGTQLENFGQMVPLPGNPIAAAHDAQFRDFGARMDDTIASTGGTPALGPGAAGDLVRATATSGDAAIRAQIAAWEDAFRNAFGTRTLVPTANARQAIEAMIRRADPASADFLRGVLADLGRAGAPRANGAVPFEVLDNFRKSIGRQAQGAGFDRQFLGPVYDGLNADIEAAAAQVGGLPYWQRMKAEERRLYSSDVPLAQGGDLPALSSATGAQADPAALYRQWVQGGYQNTDKLSVLMRNATPEQQADITATFISDLGRARPSGQSAEGDVFSTETFLTNWNKMSEGTKQLLFGQSDIIATLNDLARVAEGMRGLRRTSNLSNTGRSLVTGGAFGGAYAAGVDPLTAMLSIGGSYGTLSALASRKLAEWAAGLAPSARERIFAKLPGLSAAVADTSDVDANEDMLSIIMGGQ